MTKPLGRYKIGPISATSDATVFTVPPKSDIVEIAKTQVGFQ